MTTRKREDKRTTLSEAISLIEDESTVAIGGGPIRRHPMAMIFEIVRQEKKSLSLLGWNNSIDMDLLIGAGCVSSIETSYVGMAMLGLAANYRRAAKIGSLKITEQPETTAIDAFRAGSQGWTFFPTKTPLESGLDPDNDSIEFMKCPYTGEKYALMPAFSPDVAIIHAHVADRFGNVQLDQKRDLDNGVDALIAKSARKVIVSVEQIVAEETITANPHLTILPESSIDKIVELPFGAHPNSCDYRYDYDLKFLRNYQKACEEKSTFQTWLQKYVLEPKDHYEYLDLIGLERLWSIQQSSTRNTDSIEVH